MPEPMDAEVREALKAKGKRAGVFKRREIMRRRKKLGLCLVCGKEPALKDKKVCGPHYEHMKKLLAAPRNMAPRRPTHRKDRRRDVSLFMESLKGETLGDHPGYVDLRIQAQISNPIKGGRVELITERIELLVSSMEDIDNIMRVTKKALNDWMRGLIE